MSFGKNESCLTLNSRQTVTNLTNNSSGPPLFILAFFLPPYLDYTDWEIAEQNSSVLYYQFCGPFIVLMRCFAEYINTE